ncbi:DNA repair protein complementing XP-A cells homolog [Ruditapes philippinarum]|uniref:DNA repair protein complementing XP-A cells homolog n=1 Tax=Ruditapes philippinarum TaxID=129788 RepID=UPI00295AC360|nr:DNA repair protein complementing XP-A cells homolog [Ruditapes philippinarum]
MAETVQNGSAEADTSQVGQLQKEEMSTNKEEVDLSASQRARIERNRQRALLLRQSRLQAHPYATDALGNRVKGPAREVDTGSGFFIEDDGEEDKTAVKVVHPEGPVLEVDSLFCESCQKEFMDSYFYTKFDEPICDACRSILFAFSFSTCNRVCRRTAWILIRLRGCAGWSRSMLVPNPLCWFCHGAVWSRSMLVPNPLCWFCHGAAQMLFQVKKRSLEVWESEEKIEEARNMRQENKEKAKQKKFDKKVKDLRLAVRSSLLKKEKGSHEHEFGEEIYDDDEDVYSKTCKTCNYTMTYEKM